MTPDFRENMQTNWVLCEAPRCLDIGVSGFSNINTITLVGALARFLDAKSRVNLRPCTISMLRYYLGKFVENRETMELRFITEHTVQEWFESRREKPSAQQSNFWRLHNFFQFCVRRRWMSENPCAFIDPVRVEPGVPSVLTIAQCREVMRYCVEENPKALPFAALALFAGVRPEEITRLQWSDLDLVQGTLTVDAAASKTHRRRKIQLPPNCTEWLRLARRTGGKLPISRSTRVRWVREFRKALGLKRWPNDVMRHTAASYLLAIHENAGKVALMLGNSERILLRHYRDLVSLRDASEFWAIAPAYDSSGPAGI